MDNRDGAEKRKVAANTLRKKRKAPAAPLPGTHSDAPVTQLSSASFEMTHLHLATFQEPVLPSPFTYSQRDWPATPKFEMSLRTALANVKKLSSI
jgi:hypothetical protein